MQNITKLANSFLRMAQELDSEYNPDIGYQEGDIVTKNISLSYHFRNEDYRVVQAKGIVLDSGGLWVKLLSVRDVHGKEIDDPKILDLANELVNEAIL